MGSLVARAISRDKPLAAVVGFSVVLGLWNVSQYFPTAGYDGVEHMQYADGLIFGGNLPHYTGEYYTPPGYYTVAGVADWLARHLGVGEWHRAGMALNVAFLALTVIAVHRLALELWPTRPRRAIAAAGFIALFPLAVKDEAMFHPETLSLCLTTIALLLCVRTFSDARRAWLLGVTLGLAQLVRAPALWAVAACVLALAVGRRFKEAVIVVVIAGVIAAPWYIHQYGTYGGSPVFNRPTVQKPLFERRPAAFYVDPGIPAVVSAPYKRHFLNRLLPTTYSEAWGDYFGVWAWNGGGNGGHGRPGATARVELVVQSLVGIVPTMLALLGWIFLAGEARRRPERLPVVLVPLFGVASYLLFTVSYPTPDGDVLKATYMLTAAGAWALGFAAALDRLRGRWLQGAVAVLVVSALAELPFLLY